MRTPGERDIELADPTSIAMFRAMTPLQRLRAVSQMHDTAHRLVSGAVRRQHPDWTPQQVAAEVARRMRGHISRNRPDPPPRP